VAKKDERSDHVPVRERQHTAALEPAHILAPRRIERNTHVFLPVQRRSLSVDFAMGR
jgi:hypothetical protein